MSLLQHVDHLLVLALCDAETIGSRPIYDTLAEAFPRARGWRGLRSDDRRARRAHLLSARRPPEPLRPPLPQRSFLTTLTEHGVPWRAWHHGVSSVQLFAAHGAEAVQLRDAQALTRTLRVEEGAEALPAFSWIDPDFTRPGWAGSDDHPAGSPARAEALLAGLYDALRESPSWERSLLWVLWDQPHEARPPLLISPWLAAGLEPELSPASVAKSALHRFGRDQRLAPLPTEADDAASVFALPALDAPRRDTPRRLSAITLPELDGGAVLDDPWQTWLAAQRSKPNPGPVQRLEAFGERLAEGVERRGAATERRLVDAGERLHEAGERWLRRLSGQDEG
ncbi:MAG: hypothetical protein H6741_28960 [Alphaproteobacteria bacterium]|nr:hypothetical protein [Alphaproteobacteria bacterium]